MSGIGASPSELLPSNATIFERSHADTDGYRTLAIPLSLRVLFDPDQCPVEMLDILAYTWSVDEWEPDWPEARKREVIKASPIQHRRKGTVGALKRAVLSLGYEGLEVQEWFHYDGDPYKFRLVVDVTERQFALADYALMYRTALRSKNVRSHLENIAARLRLYVTIGAVVAPVSRAELTLKPFRMPTAVLPTPRWGVSAGPAPYAVTLTLLPQS